MSSITSFSIAACNSLRAPSRSNCSKNDLSSSSARLLSEITLLSGTWRILSFWRPRVRPPGLFLLLRGCAFSQLLIHNFRLYLTRLEGGLIGELVEGLEPQDIFPSSDWPKRSYRHQLETINRGDGVSVIEF